MKELDDEGLLVRRSGGFSKPNHLYVKIPSDEIELQPVENKAVEKIAATEPEKQPLSGRKNGCAGVILLWGSERSLFSQGWLYGDEETFQAMCL